MWEWEWEWEWEVRGYVTLLCESGTDKGEAEIFREKLYRESSSVVRLVIYEQA